MNSKIPPLSIPVITQSIENVINTCELTLFNCVVHALYDNIEHDDDKFLIDKYDYAFDLDGENIVYIHNLILAETKQKAEEKFLKSLGFRDKMPLDWLITPVDYKKIR